MSSLTELLNSINPAELRRVVAVAGGVTTMMFTDIVDSVGIKATTGDVKYLELMARHHEVIRAACFASDGMEIKTMGDAFFIAFAGSANAVAAAIEIQTRLAEDPILPEDSRRLEVRIGLHSGTPLTVVDRESERPDLLGIDVDCAARIMSLATGGQVLLSETTALLAQPAGLHDWGPIPLKGLPAPRRVFELLWRPGQIPKSPQRLPIGVPRPAIPRLFGIERSLDTISSALADENSTSAAIVSIEGVGGIGKTALAEASLQRLLASRCFELVAWYEVRPGGFEERKPDEKDGRLPPALDSLISSIASQLEMWAVATSASRTRLSELTHALQKTRSLVVVDNLETAADLRPLVELFRRAESFRPSRLLITARVSLGSEVVRSMGVNPHAFLQRVDELNEVDSVSLLRHEAMTRNLSEVGAASHDTLAQLHQMVGGNPQALRLCLGLLRNRPIEVVCRELEGHLVGPADDLFDFIYGRAWTMLTDDARQVLNAMPMFSGEGADWFRLLAVSGIDEDQFPSTIDLLTSMSLLVVKGPVESRRYSIHRLTEQFVKRVRKESQRLEIHFGGALRRNILHSRSILRESL